MKKGKSNTNQGGKPMDYKARFIDREMLAGDVMIVRVEKPEGFQFLAGQYCVVTVPDLGFQDDRGLKRPLSISSSPTEKDLLFVTKLSGSAPKRTMAEMPPGTILSLGKPMGSLTLPEDTATPLVFLAGGIGITPFRSMVRYAADAPTGHAITLFYSSRTPEETPFLDELQRIPEQHSQIGVVITMTRAGEGWRGLTGRLSPEMIKNGCNVWEHAVYYIAGPPTMADAMKQTLEAMDIPPARIKIELFGGY